jgi:signal transduction histidine kinase/CheY-like chemotaxis protein
VFEEIILVVEPNSLLLQSMVEEISAWGFKSFQAQTPEEAVELALMYTPQLLLLHLPPDSALHLLNRLGQAGCLLPAILILEQELSQISVDFLRLGVKDYLLSPFTSTQLRQAIGQQLETGCHPAIQQPVEASAPLQVQPNIKEMERLIKIGQSINAVLDQETVLSRVTEAAVCLTGAEEGYLLLLKPGTGILQVRAEQHLGEQQAQCLNLRVKDSLADSIIRSGEPVLLNGNGTQPIKIRTGYLVKSLINVPLKIDEQVIGILGVTNREANAGFNLMHLYQLSFLAEVGAVALENARLHTEMRGKLIRRVREFTTLQALITQLGFITDFEVGAQLVLSFVLKATSAEAGVLSWVGSESRDKMLYASQGVLGESVLAQSREIVWWDEKILREVMTTGKAKLWHNLNTNRVENFTIHTQARLAVPLRQGNQVVGVINLESSTPNVFTEEDLHFVRNVADQVTIALKNTILQRQIETEQKYFSLLMESVNNGVWLVDNRLNLLAQNKAANKITGWSTNPVGQALPDLLPSDNGSAPKLCRLISQAMEERQSVLFDKGIFLPTQEKYPILIGGRIFPIIQDDRATGAICSFWKVFDESQDATRKFEFADMSAHLLRSPLNLIQTSVDLLMNSKLDDQSQQRTLKRMKEQSQRLTEFTTELLRILRLEVEGTQIHPERVYLPDIIQRLVNTLCEEKRYHTFGFIAPLDTPMVAADPTKTELVLLNLLLSSVRRCSEGGHIEVALQVQGKEVVVTVTDNGQALQGKQLNQIFQQFYPVDDGYNKLPSTYHLGLYTTKRLVELQNGRVWAKSQPGYGSQFYFSLPIWE